MRKLDGVIPILNADVFRSLKQQVLLFDRIYFVHVDEETLDAQQVAECKYLAENNILVDVTTVIDVEKLPQGMDEATQMLSLLALVIWESVIWRFLGDLTSRNRPPEEIRDDIEWSLNEYTKALKVHKLKRRDGFFETYIIPVIEIAEDLAKFNWSKIANGALSARKLQIELMEAEMNAPGRKVAYIYYAKRRFGS